MVPPGENIRHDRINTPLEKARQTTTERAESLDAEGYDCRPMPVAFIFRVILPEPKVDRKTGEVTDHYLVDLCGGTCTCPGFYYMRGTCKHLLWVREKFEAAKAFLTPTYKFDQSSSKPAPQSAPAPHRQACPHCSGDNLIDVPGFPDTFVCGRCGGLIEPEEAPAYPVGSTKTVAHPSDFDY